METALIERLRIRELIENWALWRDAGDWTRFATVWHPEGRMMATWFQGSAADFIAAHIIEVTERAFDDFAESGADDAANRKMLGL